MSEPWSKMEVRCALWHNAEWGEYKDALGYAGSLCLGSHRRVCSMRQNMLLACKQSSPSWLHLVGSHFLPVLEMVLWKSPGIQHLHYIYVTIPKTKGKKKIPWVVLCSSWLYVHFWETLVPEFFNELTDIANDSLYTFWPALVFWGKGEVGKMLLGVESEFI